VTGAVPPSPSPSPSPASPPEPLPEPSPAPPSLPPPRRVTLVLGTTAGGTGTHVRMLATGLAARGVAVTVAGPPSAGARLSFPGGPAVPFAAVEIGVRPRPGDLATILRLRGLLAAARRGAPQGAPAATGSPGARLAVASPGRPGVVHAHGLRAGALSLLALALVRGARRPRTVVTVHNAPPSGGGAPALVYRLLERVVARRADLVLCASPDLEARMRAAGARRVGPAVIRAPGPACPARGPAGRWRAARGHTGR
jgi:hypothetical protein